MLNCLSQNIFKYTSMSKKVMNKTSASVQSQRQRKRSQTLGISPDFLNGKKVKAIHRMQLKLWFMAEMKDINIFRETYTIASRFLDIYIAHSKDQLKLKSFQNLGISCFMLASKLNERITPPFTFQKYGVQQIEKFQGSLCELLQFKMSEMFPVTYFHLAENIMSRWDQFAQFNHLNIFYMNKCQKSMRRYLMMMDTLDLVDLTPKVYEFEVEQLVLNLFYAYTKDMFEQQQENISFLEIENGFECLFRSFIEFLGTASQQFSECFIKEETIDFLREFLVVEFVHTVKVNRPISYMSNQQYRHYLIIQNLNPNHENFSTKKLKNLQ